MKSAYAAFLIIAEQADRVAVRLTVGALEQEATAVEVPAETIRGVCRRRPEVTVRANALAGNTTTASLAAAGRQEAPCQR